MNSNAFDLYQRLAARTRNKDITVTEEFANYALGLCGEAGEVGDLIKKRIFHGHQLDVDDLMKELGDVLWYLSNVATLAGIDLSEVATKNIDKLNKRYKDGFSHEASVNREE